MKSILKTIALSALLLCAGCTGEPSGEDVKNYVKVGDEIPEFVLKAPDGTLTGSGDYFGGKRSVIMFFWSPCGDCKREMPKVWGAWNELGSDPDIKFANISRGEDPATLAEYWETAGFGDMPYFLDQDKSIFGLFANKYVPRIYLVGSDGRVKYMAIERFDFDAEGLIELINELE